MRLKELITLVAGALFFLALHAVRAQAQQPLVAEAPVLSVGSKYCTSISTSAPTAVISGTAMAGRSGIFVRNLSTNSASMDGTLVNSTASAPTGTTPNELGFPTSVGWHFIPASDKVTLYVISRHTAAEVMCAREVKQ